MYSCAYEGSKKPFLVPSNFPISVLFDFLAAFPSVIHEWMYAETFACMYAEFGCMYAETVGCKVCGNSWVHVCGCRVHVCGDAWVQSMRMLGACMRKRLGPKYAETPGCMYADFGCMYMETLGCKVCGCLVQVYGAVGCLPDCPCFA